MLSLLARMPSGWPRLVVVTAGFSALSDVAMASTSADTPPRRIVNMPLSNDNVL